MVLEKNLLNESLSVLSDGIGFSFHSVGEEDLKIIQDWKKIDFVKEWYSDDVIDCAVEEYRKIADSKALTKGYIIQKNNDKVGYIQFYFILDYLEDCKKILDKTNKGKIGEDYLEDCKNVFDSANKGTVGVNMFVGNVNYIHKGFGKYILSDFLRDVVFENSDVSNVFIVPERKNIVAIKTYTKVGFNIIKENIKNLVKEVFVMELKKENFNKLLIN